MSLKKYIQDHKKAFDDQQMSLESTVAFEKLLKKELHKPKQVKGKLIRMKYWAVAASIVLLISLGVNYSIDKKVAKENKMALVNNLEDTSVGARLEGIYEFNDEYTKEDDQIISILINLLHEDNNVNVKIATIDALLKYPENTEIRSNFLIALEKEKQPLVQIKLIKSISLLKEQRAQELLEELIENNETLPIVKNNAHLAMSTFKQ